MGQQTKSSEPRSSDAELVTPVGHFTGREQVLGFLKAYWDAFPDARLEIVRSIEDGSLAAAEGTMIGTHSGTLRTPQGDIPPTRRSVEIRWMGMYEVRGEELASEHLYFDQAEFMTQLGVTSSPPAEAATQA
jgi:predicted ester cyclase